MELSNEQKIAFNKYLQGKNVFITGPGGSGKSELIRLIHKHAISRFKDIHVTALTGCASILLNCKAKTLHSWAGIGLGNGSLEQLILKIKKNKFQKAIWKQTDILVVDEISMLSLKLFNMLNEIGKAIRGNQRPFGGIHLIFSGDFYQLPPVGDNLEPDTQKFCFESESWNDVFPLDCQIELKKIFRQTDEIYSTILNQIREGIIKRKSNDLLLKYVGRELSPNLVAEPTKLYPTKNKVEQINFTKMSLLNGEEKEYKIKYIKDLEMSKGQRDIRKEFNEKDIQLELDYLSGNLMCEKEMKLKIGAQVMCIINKKSEEGDVLICNGSQGIITEFCTFTGCPKVKFNNGIEMIMTRHVWESDKIPGIGVAQIPLILSWALTIHKSQGATLDSAEIDVGSGIFECGQTYVALSRLKSLDGLYLTSFDAKRIRINKKVKEYYDALRIYKESKLEEEINLSIDINSFKNYEYHEDIELNEDIELKEDTYEEDEIQSKTGDENQSKTGDENKNIKIIRINL